jgi:CDP-2,3-bis-(O-geranylgeranyl)-sn-glycerol synthase
MTGPGDPALPTLLAVSLWFLLPAGAANMAPVIAAWLLPSWDLPVDLGRHLGDRRLFGSHKTWRGMVAGVVAGALVSALQGRLLSAFPVLRDLLPDQSLGELPSLFGAWIGLGALTGDLVKSFFKRRVGIPPGRSWFPFDQIDWLLGALAFAAPFLPLSAADILAILLVGLVLHLAGHALGRALGLNESWI